MGEAVDKTLNVVFLRKKSLGDVLVSNEDIRFAPQCREISRDIAKQSILKKIETMRAEHERMDGEGNFKFLQLAKAVDEASTQEIFIANDFVDKVESTMKCFNIDIGKYQEMYKKVMKNLHPSLSSVTNVEETTTQSKT